MTAWVLDVCEADEELRLIECNRADRWLSDGQVFTRMVDDHLSRHDPMEAKPRKRRFGAVVDTSRQPHDPCRGPPRHACTFARPVRGARVRAHRVPPVLPHRAVPRTTRSGARGRLPRMLATSQAVRRGSHPVCRMGRRASPALRDRAGQAAGRVVPGPSRSRREPGLGRAPGHPSKPFGSAGPFGAGGTISAREATARRARPGHAGGESRKHRNVLEAVPSFVVGGHRIGGVPTACPDLVDTTAYGVCCVSEH